MDLDRIRKLAGMKTPNPEDGKFEIEIPVPGGTVEVEFEPNSDYELNQGDDEEFEDEEFEDEEFEDEEFEDEEFEDPEFEVPCCDDNTTYMNVVDTNRFRTHSDDDDENMLVDMDEDAEDFDYGHKTAIKRGRKYRLNAFTHKVATLDADKPDTYKHARSGSNPMNNPVTETKSIYKSIMEAMGEDLKLYEDMKLTSGNKRVIQSFIDQEPADDNKLSTDGRTLEGLWIGGRDIAHWGNGKIVLGQLDSRAKQTIQNFIKKTAPRNIISGLLDEENTTLLNENPISLTLNEHEYKMLIAAIIAVSPSGGGSAQYSLARNIMKQTGLQASNQEIVRLQTVAYNEIKEYEEEHKSLTPNIDQIDVGF